MYSDTGDPNLSKARSSLSTKLRLALQATAAPSEPKAGEHWQSLLSTYIEPTLEEFKSSFDGLAKGKATSALNVELAVDDLRRHLASVLSRLFSRVFVLELNIHRLKGLLEGNSPEKRFNYFIQYMRQPETLQRVLNDYPVLADDLEMECWQALSFHSEFYSRLVRDWELLSDAFFHAQSDLKLKHFETGLGDRHNGGRTVCVLRFNTDQMLVYKPRPLDSDETFNGLLQWFNSRSKTGNHLLQTLNVVNRDRYGWMEFAAAEPCYDAAQVRSFYVRMGKLLGILYILHATDFHYGNVIAKQEFPLLIDFEGLFHGMVRATGTNIPTGADAAIADSVLTTGLLPRRLQFDKSLDTSGIGGEAGQPLPWEVSHWETPGTDQMKVSKKAAQFSGGLNRPTLNGASQSALQYCDEIVNGFIETYELGIEFRQDLLSNDGPLHAFKRCSLRTILRPTYLYAQLLMDLRHPDNLRNIRDRQNLLSKLDQASSGPEWRAIAKAEKEDLLRGDIPYFISSIESRDIHASYGFEIQDALAKTGLDAAIERLQGLGPDDLRLQVNLIRSAISSLSPTVHNTERSEVVGGRLTSSLKEPLTMARDIAIYLCESAIRHNNRVEWLGLTLKPGNFLSVEPLGLDLYSGLPGVCLFLAYYSLLADCRRVEKVAEEALETLLARITSQSDKFNFIGGYAGIGGLIAGMLLLHERWPNKGLLEVARSLLPIVVQLIPNDVSFDYVYGAAGCLAALLVLHRTSPDASVLAAALSCGDLLVKSAVPQGTGLGWLGPVSPQSVLSGFSHGVAGIASALVALGNVSGDETYLETARAAIKFERTLYIPAIRNWKDCRPEVIVSGQSMKAWCHGAAGIGLSRLLIAKFVDDSTILDELHVSLGTTLEGGFGGNHSLCHGDLGNLEICMALSTHLGASDALDKILDQRERMLKNAQKTGWICGNPGGAASPGLMTGLAGIGYGLLRLNDPDHVPSVLYFS